MLCGLDFVLGGLDFMLGGHYCVLGQLDFVLRGQIVLFDVLLLASLMCASICDSALKSCNLSFIVFVRAMRKLHFAL